jgi:hypothetical protein
MDRRAPGIRADGADRAERDEPRPEAGAPSGPLCEAERDRILPPIDEDDPEWQAYVRRKVRESLDDPRPPIPAEEVRRRILERHEAYLKRGA